MRSLAGFLNHRLMPVLKNRPISLFLFLVGLVLMLISVDGLVPGVHLNIEQQPRVAAVGTCLAFLAGAPLLFAPGGGISAWGYLLLEHNELSLGRTQVFLWVIPAVSIYGGLVLPHLTLMGFPEPLAPILGGSLATAVLGAATAPSKDALKTLEARKQPDQGSAAPESAVDAFTDSMAKLYALDDQQKKAVHDQVSNVAISLINPPDKDRTEAPATPRLIQLVEDFREQGDITRYQFLFLTALGSFLLLATYLKDGSVSTVPSDMLYLMGGSALGYLGTKAVKTISIENEAARKK